MIPLVTVTVAVHLKTKPCSESQRVLCVCQLRHPPLREANPSLKDLWLGLKFQQPQRVSQPTAKALPERNQIFLPEHSPSYEGLQAQLAGLAGLVVQR